MLSLEGAIAVSHFLSFNSVKSLEQSLTAPTPTSTSASHACIRILKRRYFKKERRFRCDFYFYHYFVFRFSLRTECRCCCFHGPVKVRGVPSRDQHKRAETLSPLSREITKLGQVLKVTRIIHQIVPKAPHPRLMSSLRQSGRVSTRDQAHAHARDVFEGHGLHQDLPAAAGLQPAD